MEDQSIHRTHFVSVSDLKQREKGEVKTINGTQYVWDGKKWCLLSALLGENILSLQGGRTWD